MSTGSISTNGSTISFSGLASGLDTSSIIQALLAAEKAPITHLTDQQEALTGEQAEIGKLQTTLQELSFQAFEFTLPSLFEGTQTASSSEPARVSASITSGAGIGGYEVNVTQLAASAQRTFAFTAPGGEGAVKVDGREYQFKAGTTAKELAAEINADGKGTVYAAAENEATIVLSSRETGASEGGFIDLEEGGGVLAEKAGTAKEGRDAEYTVDGVEGKSRSNVVTEAIPGVTLTFAALTPAGPVTIAVQPPAPNVAAIQKQLESFVGLYNSTVEAVQTQLTTKPVSNPQNASERGTGALFGDPILTGLLAEMRQTMYETIEGTSADMSSPLSLGVSTGAATGGTSSNGSIEGLLKLDPEKLASAIAADPEGAKTMMAKWATRFQQVVSAVSGPTGSLTDRVEGDAEQVRELKERISSMNEILAMRQKALEQTYAELEAVISRNSAQSSWLTGQVSSLEKSGL